MPKFRYLILCNGKIIASFLNESDRNTCIDTLQEKFEDCVFEAQIYGFLA